MDSIVGIDKCDTHRGKYRDEEST